MSSRNTVVTPDEEGRLDLQPPSRHGRWWKRAIVLIVAIAVALVMLSRMSGNGSEVPVQYKTEPARRGNLVVTVTATGNLEPVNQVEVGSELSGILKTVEVDSNDQVKVGQALATLDTSKLDAQIKQGMAALESARAQALSSRATVVESRAALARLEELQKISDGKGVSKKDLDAAQAAVDRAVADEAKTAASVNQAQAALDANQTDLAKAVIRSPINGVVLTRSVDPGQTVAASLQSPTLFLLAEDLAKMQLAVDVDEADVGQVASGQEAIFTVDAFSGREFPARIHRVSYGAATTDGVVTYETLLDVDNSDLSLRPGMTATATITVKKIEDALLVPNTALRFTPPVTQTAAASGGSIVDKILPRPPQAPAKTKTETDGAKNHSVVWTLKNYQLASVSVTPGSTDGTMTEILDGDIQPDTELAVDTMKAAP